MAEARMNGVEATVMALWDAGRSSQQIAAALQLNPEWVRKIVSMFDAGADRQGVRMTARTLFEQLGRTIATAEGKSDSRLRRMKAIRAACHRLGIDDDDRRSIQLELVGVASLKDMDGRQLDIVLDHLNRGHAPGRGRGERGVAGKVRALWWTLYWLAAVDQPNDRAIDAFVKRQTGAEALRFLGHRQAHSVIDALKSWAAREGVDWPVPADPIADRRAVAGAIWFRLIQVAPMGNVDMAHLVARDIGAGADVTTWSARTWDDAIRHLGKRWRREKGRP